MERSPRLISIDTNPCSEAHGILMISRPQNLSQNGGNVPPKERVTVLGSALHQWIKAPIITPLALASVGRLDLANRVGQTLGRQLQEAGFTSLIGPKVGVADSSVWCAGTDPELSARILCGYVKGLADAGITPYIYLSSADTIALDLVQLERKLFRVLRPMLDIGGVGLLVPKSVFVSIDDHPADESVPFVQGVIRGILRFQGPVARIVSGCDAVDQYGNLGIDTFFVDDDQGRLTSTLRVPGSLSDTYARGEVPGDVDVRVSRESVTLLRDNGVLPIARDAGTVCLDMTGEAKASVTNPFRRCLDVKCLTKAPSTTFRQEIENHLERGEGVICLVGSFSQRWQQRFIAQLAELPDRGPIVVICTGDPTTAAAFPQADVICLTYGLGVMGLQAALQALQGERPWRGRLPVDIGKQISVYNQTQSPADRLCWYSTEDPNPGARDLDGQDIVGLVESMNRVDEDVVYAVRKALPQVASAVQYMSQSLEAGGNVYYVGAGSAGRIGIFDSAEIPPTFGYDASRVQAIMAGGQSAQTSANEGAEDSAEAAARQVAQCNVGPRDTLVAITAHGETPYAVGAVEEAKSRGAATIALVNNPGTPISLIADLTIEVFTGPEFLVGSTRLKAGTAEKLVLNMLSTVTMIQLGRVYDNLMVDFKAKNNKLRTRAENVVMWVTGIARKEAHRCLTTTEWRVKEACAIAGSGQELGDIQRNLERLGGSLRRFLADYGNRSGDDG